MRSSLSSVLNWLMAAAFAVFAGLQINDPDLVYWFTFYALGSLACVLFHLKRLPPAAALSFAILCGVLALLWILLTALGQPLPGKVPGMESEEEKEVLGFVLVGVWMGVLYYRGKRMGMT